MIQDWLERLRDYWSASRRNQVIVFVSGVVLAALLVGGIAMLANRGGASANGIAQATATPLPQMPAGTAQITPVAPQSTPLPTKPVNLAIVGGTKAGFTATYGKPTGTGVDSGNGLPTVSYKGNGPVGAITIELDSTKSFVVGVVISAPQNAPFDATNLQAISLHFAPSDASYDTAQSITNGSNQEVALFQLGHSLTLATTLPDSVFTDYQGQFVSRGTFSTEIYYIAGANGQLAYAVSLRLGNQPASPGA